MENDTKKIGVLALQGDFIEHIAALRRLGVDAVEVRLPADLQDLSGLIIPGGESTTIGKLAVSYGLMDPLRHFGRHKALWGTCAGMILMAKEIGMDQPLLGLMDIKVQRNAFGRQKESFRSDITVPVLEEGDVRPFPAVFIRAPKLLSASGKAKVIASLPDGTVVAAQEDKWLVTSFHPELTTDDRFHRYFLGLV
ncbi:MAG: pyridoxal 5'-phosphate synthase glutaminase subunit PdxT [Desulfobacterales bacterium]|nr:pyridoxal 5'-phosphate synthase glutaminase subunit PdxT [Desulfobacterales bacterium]